MTDTERTMNLSERVKFWQKISAHREPTMVSKMIDDLSAALDAANAKIERLRNEKCCYKCSGSGKVDIPGRGDPGMCPRCKGRGRI